jgi:hypothetical protein
MFGNSKVGRLAMIAGVLGAMEGMSGFGLFGGGGGRRTYSDAAKRRHSVWDANRSKDRAMRLEHEAWNDALDAKRKAKKLEKQAAQLHATAIAVQGHQQDMLKANDTVKRK